MTTKRRISDGPTREDQTRATIIAAAKRLVKAHGLHKVTMEDIASAVGKKKSFLYYYYPSRREVLEAFIQDEFAQMRQHVREAVAAKQGASAQLRTFIIARMETVLALVAGYGATTIATLRQGAEPGTDLGSLLDLRKELDREEERFVGGILRQGIKEGVFRPLSDKAIQDIGYFLLSALRGVEFELALSREPPTAAPPVFTKVLEIFLRGLAAE